MISGDQGMHTDRKQPDCRSKTQHAITKKTKSDHKTNQATKRFFARNIRPEAEDQRNDQQGQP
jgi:hypothetical protein